VFGVAGASKLQLHSFVNCRRFAGYWRRAKHIHSRSERDRTGPRSKTHGIPFIFLVGAGVFGMVRTPRRKRPAFLSVAMLIACLTVLPSCGGGGTTGGGSPSPAVSISITPISKTVFTSTSLQFSVTVNNTTNTQVNWHVNGVASGNSTYGTIGNTGLYTAPAAVPNPAQFSVTAVSQADSTKSASAVVTIASPTPSGTYNVTITANSGGAVHIINAVLVVQ
jgi:hypothetical protein